MISALGQSVSTDQLSRALLSGEVDPVAYDYGAMRFQAESEAVGWERLVSLEQSVSAQIAPPDVRDGDRLRTEDAGCAGPAVLAGILLAKQAPDAVTYAAARRQAVDLYTRASTELQAQLEAAPSTLDAAIVRDRFWRALMLERSVEETSAFAREFELHVLYAGLCQSDRSNARYLRSLLANHDQFFEIIYEPDDRSLHELVQHAPLSLQQEVLDLMRLRPDFGASAHQRRAEAYLTDRVRVAQQAPQLYATQGQCIAGRWAYVRPVDLDAARVRREQAGLAPLDDARARQDEACRTRLGVGDVREQPQRR